MNSYRETKNKFISICGVKIDMLQTDDVICAMENWIRNREFGNYIVVSNAYDLVANASDERIKKAANSSSLTIPDGISLILLARLHGYSLKKRVYGPDLTLEFLKLAEIKGYSNFFYGSTLKTLELLVNNLKVKFPQLKIVGAYAPPFIDLSDEEKVKVRDVINHAAPDVLWVGLGTPKQQFWMYEYKNKLKVPVMVGIGAAFDFLAVTKPQAPRWIRDNGFEWLFRLIAEPKRLWKRYLVGNSIFLWLFLKEFIKVKILKKDMRSYNK